MTKNRHYRNKKTPQIGMLSNLWDYNDIDSYE